MLSKLSLSEKAIIYSAPTGKTITNTICDAVDSATTQAHAYTATVKSTFDEVTYSGSATDIDLAASSRLTLGVFLANNQDQSQLVHVVGTLRILYTSATYTGFHTFGFGRCNASTVTQSDAAAANTIDNTIFIPGPNYTFTQNGLTGTTYLPYFVSVNQYILVDKKTTTSDNPLCFYLQIINSNAANVVLFQFAASLSIRSMNYAVPINSPSGV